MVFRLLPSSLSLSLLLAAVVTPVFAAEPAAFRIENQTILTSPKGIYYSQTRATVLPGQPGRILLTAQEMESAGTHAFRDLYQSISADGGRTWSTPVVIAPLKRAKMPDGFDHVMGDTTPLFHQKTGLVLSTGKTFSFKDGVKEDRSREQVSYAVCDPSKGANGWSPLHTLELPAQDHSKSPILQPNSGCCQRVDDPSGDILLPIRYCRDPKKLNYTTTVARCKFDGKQLTYVEHGAELTVPQGRGLYEPSLTRFGGSYFLTMRADNSAYVARSKDGLNYEPVQPWKFDDGTPLGSYNTQQHWVTHSGGLYLVYTRKGAGNDHVFRHRAPLFIARVDPQRLCVVRASEQVLVPEEGADLGNFGVVDISPGETWVVTAESPAKKQETNRVLIARIKWQEPNALMAPSR